MGKTTTKFTGSINTLTDHVNLELGKLNTLLLERKPLNAKAMAQVKIMDDACEKHMPGGLQTEGSEQRLEKDPLYIQASKEIDKVNGMIIGVDARIRTAKAALKAALKALSEENVKFEAYVKKKKAKWFGTKNSVPAAELCIQTAKDLIEASRHLIV